LKELYNVSQVELTSNLPQSAGDDGVANITVNISPADGTKCERCWNYRTDTAQFGPWSTVCGRCADALRHMPEFAPLENAGSVNA
jgi:isoleucyl-tRNA synthetase